MHCFKRNPRKPYSRKRYPHKHYSRKRYPHKRRPRKRYSRKRHPHKRRPRKRYSRKRHPREGGDPVKVNTSTRRSKLRKFLAYFLQKVSSTESKTNPCEPLILLASQRGYIFNLQIKIRSYVAALFF